MIFIKLCYVVSLLYSVQNITHQRLKWDPVSEKKLCVNCKQTLLEHCVDKNMVHCVQCYNKCSVLPSSWQFYRLLPLHELKTDISEMNDMFYGPTLTHKNTGKETLNKPT